MKTLKYIALLVSVALTAISCSKTGVSESSDSDAGYILPDVKCAGEFESKAIYDPGSIENTMKGDSNGISFWICEGGDGTKYAAAPYKLFWETAASSGRDAPRWIYYPLRTWVLGETFYFLAFYPKSDGDSVGKWDEGVNYYAKTSVSVDFNNVDGSYKEQVDKLFARNKVTAVAESNTVPLEFKHCYAKLLFQIKSNYPVTVNEFDMFGDGIYQDRTCCVWIGGTGEPTVRFMGDGTVSERGVFRRTTGFNNIDAEHWETAAHNLFAADDGEPALVIPSAVATGIYKTFKLTYTYIPAGSSGEVQQTATLSSDAIPWAYNTAYTVVLKLNPELNEITVDSETTGEDYTVDEDIVVGTLL